MSKSPPGSANLSAVIDAALPQTQCTRCGYPACLPYAQAIAEGSADINQCPPGGDAGIRKLAAITGIAYKPLNPVNGVETSRKIAAIDEARCIGCTVCIKACPVDAIVGGFKFMHTVITQDCTGCELCVAPCPVDCIVMHDAPTLLAWSDSDAALARQRYQARQARLARLEKESTRAAMPAKEVLGDVLARARARASQRLRDKT